MPRAPRIETNQGLYHVLNRGNYRRNIFDEQGAKLSFEKCLFEACQRSGWDLFAYCLMDNHYHLCIGTPKGNLSEGMRWLQGTYAARYNRLRKEMGHLFQGRFKSLLVEPGRHFLALIEYIHLNPLRAGLVESDRPQHYRWSSLYWFPKKKRRPGFLKTDWMDYDDYLVDSPTGWKHYMTALRMRNSDDPVERDRLEKRMCRGWCIGDQEFKKSHVEEYLLKKETLRLEKEELADLNESQWRLALNQCLKLLEKTEENAKQDKFSVDWKLAIATKLRTESSVRNAWLSEHLHMGVPRGISSNCSLYAKRKNNCPFYKQLQKLKL